MQGVNPGGYYQAIWCRDAAYILRDQFLSGNVSAALQQACLIWSHQIEPHREILVYGRGSPEMNFVSETAQETKEREFAGALPTTIYQEGFCEVYAQNPDIDSTALMISATSWILVRVLKDANLAPTIINAMERSSDYLCTMTNNLGPTDPIRVVDPVVDRMLKAVDFLACRDVDNDGLLEQNHNEDWMDTALRAGKIVYSQACWILALKDISRLLSSIGKDAESERTRKMAAKAIQAVDQNLWSEGDGCYIDLQQSDYVGGSFRMLTQDVSMYLVAVTDHPALDTFSDNRETMDHQSDSGKPLDHELIYKRANHTLDAIRRRVWKDNWPLVTEVELKRTGPGIFKPYNYHNQTFWPWTTGMEMLARGRFGRVEECDILLSALASENQLRNHAFWEWVNPITNEGSGAFPFKTGVSAVRIAISDILEKLGPKP
jgi:glycogen debranching enzyme